MIDGIINVYKEKGFTSHDVVAKLRGILKQKKSVFFNTTLISTFQNHIGKVG